MVSIKTFSIFYMIDFSTTCSESTVTMFADDTTVIYAGKRIDSLVRNDMKKKQVV